ncbi:MAG: glycosyltransferase family 39 protein [Armatimonadetes bacterium]|nr:glycosyltransferase family 39 protein [Armatimonadota bacterium]
MGRAPVSAESLPSGLALVILLLLVVVCQLLAFVVTGRDSGPDSDEALFAYIAHFWAKGDLLPYRDAFENKPPGIFLAYRLFMGDGSRILGGTRLAAVCAQLLAAALLGLLVSSFQGKRVGLTAGLLVAGFLLRRGLHGHLADTEAFMAPFVCAGMLVAWQSVTRQRVGFALLGGLFLGCAFLFKPVAAAETAALAISFVLLRLPMAALLALVGAATPIALSFAWAASAGILREYWQVAFVSLTAHDTHPAALGDIWRSLGTFLMPYLRTDGVGLIALAALGLAPGWKAPAPVRPVLLLARWWALLSILAMAGSGWFYPHQYKPVVPAVVLLGACAVGRFRDLDRQWRNVVGLAAAAFLALFLWEPADSIMAARADKGDWIGARKPLVEYIQRETPEREPVYVVGLRSEVYILSDRVSPSRFFNVVFVQGHVAELMDDLTRNPPAVIALDALGRRCMRGEFGNTLGGFIASRYTRATVPGLEGWTVYRLARTPQAGGGRPAPIGPSMNAIGSPQEK